MNIRKFLFFTLVAGINVLTYSLPSRAMEEDVDPGARQTSLSHLPNELHDLIVSNLRIKELGVLASVDKYWNAVAEKDESWRGIAVRELILDSEEVQEKEGLKALVKKVVSSPIVMQVKNATGFPFRVRPEVVVTHGPSVEAINKWNNMELSDRFPSTVGQTLIILPPRKLEDGQYITIRQGEIEDRVLTQIKKKKDENTDISADEIEGSGQSPAQNDSSVYTLASMNLRLGKTGKEPLSTRLKNDEGTEINVDEMMESVSSPAQNDFSFYTGRELNLKPVIVNFYPDTEYKYNMIPRSSGYVPLKIVSDE
ncbi:MAG: hypothetical protein BGO67_10895 [Alphaproteobacteria bacterium 41-28]|nr:MAG: hypothetical protein BGO67_10895 [Alphaproteobacteria bacterium 41-28]